MQQVTRRKESRFVPIQLFNRQNRYNTFVGLLDALAPFGVGIFEMPITPQRIRQLLREAGCEVQ
jgi:hypothetical protein